ncbi:MAG: glycosyltransferase family 39 protein [Candidatus Woesearchaeota archaeon]|nr:glycosyltransferase family 39 protein [Candidatus Woesearchaeota archaeon]
MKLGKCEKYLIAILLFALLLRLVFFTGGDHSDSLLYFIYADEIVDGTYKPTSNHFSSRIGLIYPQAWIYRLFGLNDFTSNIFTLLASLAGIVLIFYFGKFLFNEKTGIIAALLLSFYPLDVIFSTRLMPDFPSAFFMALAVFLFLKAEKSPAKSRIYYLACGLSLGISYLIKEIAVIMVFFFLAYVIYKRKFRKEYFLIVAGFAVLLLLEFWHSYAFTGNILFRHTQIESEEVNYVLETYSNYFTPFGMISRLFFHWPFTMLNDIHYGLFFMFIFIALYYSITNRKDNTNILLIWLITLMLYLNFGTLSTQRYIPIPLTVKFLSIITFPSLLLLANFLSNKEKIITKIIMPATLLLLFFSSIGFIYLSNDRTLIDEVKEIYPFVDSQNKEIYTDERTQMVLNYLSGFSDKKNIKSFNKFDFLAEDKNTIVDLRNKHDVFVLVNRAMIDGLPILYKDIEFPDQINNIPKNWQIKKEVGQGDKKVIVYYVP